MKRINIKSCLMVGIACFALGLSGCISIPNSPTPRFYTLTPIDESSVGTDLVSARMPVVISNRLKAMIIGIGPVKIPEYLNRPQMVTMTPEKMLQFAQFNRWGESLDLGLARLIREDLTSILPGTKLTLYPWNPLITVKYQVAVEVIQLDSELAKDMHFVVQWTVIDVQNSKTVMIKRSEFRLPIVSHNYVGLAQTLSTACSSLSDQIADALASLK